MDTPAPSPHPAPSRTGMIVFCFALIYSIWGSTYLAIKIAIAEMPPMLMAAARFTIAGTLLYGLGRIRKEAPLTAPEKKIAWQSGALLVLANSMVCVAEKWLSSGTTAVLIGSIPIWMILANTFFFGGTRPSVREITGIVISLVGVLLLSGAQIGAEEDTGSWAGIAILLTSVIAWSFGSLMQRKAAGRPNIFTFSGFQLFIGSAAAWLIGFVFESKGGWQVSQFSLPAIAAFLYLVVFGSAVAFSAYLWLNRNVSPAQVSTYAVVNPLVAVWLGWALAGETVTSKTLLFSALILVGTYLVVFRKKPKPQ